MSTDGIDFDFEPSINNYEVSSPSLLSTSVSHSKAASVASSRKSSFSFIANRRGSGSLFKLSSKCDPFKKYGTDIGEYELLEVIGGVDDVSFLYLAKHRTSGDPVALKYTDLTL